MRITRSDKIAAIAWVVYFIVLALVLGVICRM